MAGEYIDSCKGKAFAVLFFVFVGGMAAGALSLKVYQRYDGAEVAAARLDQHQHQPTLAVEKLREELDLNVKWGIGYKLAVIPPITYISPSDRPDTYLRRRRARQNSGC